MRKLNICQGIEISFADKVPVQNSSLLSRNIYSSIGLNYDTMEKGVVVMISLEEDVQFRLELDNDTRNILSKHGHDPDSHFFGQSYSWSTKSDYLFSALADFRAGLLYQIPEKESTTSCHLSTKSCVKLPDMFNLMHDTHQHLYKIYTTVIPALLMILPENKLMQTLNTYPLIFSVILPALLFASFMLLPLPLCCLIRQVTFKPRSKPDKNEFDDKVGEYNMIDNENMDINSNECPTYDLASCLEKLDEETERRKKKDKERSQYCFKSLLGIFLMVMILIFPFSIKVAKRLIQSKLPTEIYHRKPNGSRWLLVIYKFLWLSSSATTCPPFSDPVITSFWQTDSNITEYDDKFLEQSLNKQQENFELFSEELLADSLTISFSVLFHFVAIYTMLRKDIFKKIYEQWSCGLLRRKVYVLLLILACLVINLSRYFICLINATSWISFAQSLGMLFICSPSSVILEWIFLRMYWSYLTMFKQRTLQFISYCSFFQPCVVNLLHLYLASGYLPLEELKLWKSSVSRYTKVISSHLKLKTSHQVKILDTGSIVERFGLPLSSTRKGIDYLKTDHDVMFAVSLNEESMSLVKINGQKLYYNLKSLKIRCNNSIHECFIGNTNCKTLMNETVSNLSLKDVEPNISDRRNFLGLSCINIHQHILKWDQVQTTITGPALNFRVKSAHLSHSQTTQNEWSKRVDCDFIFAFHLDQWPEVAGEWLTRKRQWPSQEIVMSLVKEGCHVVPKSRSIQDNKSWRISFSTTEVALSNLVGEKARKTFLAVKLLVKKKLKPVCPFLKSYHIKTLFLNYMEGKTKDHWENAKLELTMAIQDFAEYVVCAMESGHCPHHFISSVNLWEEESLGQLKQGCEIIRKSVGDNLSKTIIPHSFRSEELLKQIFQSSNSCLLTTTLVFLVAVLLIPSLPVILLAITVILHTFLSWLLGMVMCLPVIIVYCCIILYVRHLFPSFTTDRSTAYLGELASIAALTRRRVKNTEIRNENEEEASNLCKV